MRKDSGRSTGSREPSQSSVSRPDGFDPERMSNPWRVMVETACADARTEALNGQWMVDGQRADFLGARAMQIVADTTGLRIAPTPPSDYHEGRVFTPAIAMDAQSVETEGLHPKDDSAGRQASPDSTPDTTGDPA